MEITIKINGRFMSVEVSPKLLTIWNRPNGTIGSSTGSVSGIGPGASATST